MNRPVGVWIVSVWCLLTVLVGAFGIYALAVKVQATQTPLFAAFSTVDHIASILFTVSVGLGGVLLFSLRRSALWFFIAAIGVRAALDVWQLSMHGFLSRAAAIYPIGLWLSLGVAWVILFAVVIYTANLSRKGALA